MHAFEAKQTTVATAAAAVCLGGVDRFSDVSLNLKNSNLKVRFTASQNINILYIF
jgi:hypothetical protein